MTVVEIVQFYQPNAQCMRSPYAFFIPNDFSGIGLGGVLDPLGYAHVPAHVKLGDLIVSYILP